MEYRKLANSDLALSVITFGAWAAGGWMWGSTNRNNAIDAIRKSYELGVTSIDTAPIYGQGESEEIVGEAIKVLPRDKVQILTKFGMRWDLAKGAFAFKSKDNQGKPIHVYKYAGKDSVIKECEDSLKRLGTDYIDLYQIHWHDEVTPIHETFEAVAQLVKDGKVRNVGVCNYRPEWIKEAEKVLPIVSAQLPYSMVNRKIEADTLPFCIEANKSILAYSPLERGLLTGKIDSDYRFADGDHRADHPSFTPDSIERTNLMLEKLNPIAYAKGLSLSQLVLRWTVQRPGITIALAGARDVAQATQNAKAGEFTLSEEEMNAINTILG